MIVENKTILTEKVIQVAIAQFTGWKYLPDTKELQREWKFQKFVPTMVLLRKITEVMDSNNHHCDIHLDSRKKSLVITVTTHSENAISQADIDFAKAVNAI